MITGQAGLGKSAAGFTLVELVTTLAVLTILTLAVVPLVKLSVKRQREQQLRESLREIRAAIDQFHREALVGQCRQSGQVQALQPATAQQFTAPNPQTAAPNSAAPMPPNAQLMVDPRTKVAITDQKVFKPDNPDCFPPDLDTLVKGVDVQPIGGGAGVTGGAGLAGTTGTATSAGSVSLKKKVYLREIPVDPMTGKPDWDLRSCYDTPDATEWGGENVFDVRSKSPGVALNGEKYSDW